MGEMTPTLSFDGGCLTIQTEGESTKTGSGYMSFKNDDLGWADHITRFVDLPKSELVAIRDFLIEHLRQPGDTGRYAGKPEDALRLIAFLRPAGDVNTAKNACKLVEQMEKIALTALRDAHVL